MGAATYGCICGRVMRIEAVPVHGWYAQHLSGNSPHTIFMTTGFQWEDNYGKTTAKQQPPAKPPGMSNRFLLAAGAPSTTFATARVAACASACTSSTPIIQQPPASGLPSQAKVTSPMMVGPSSLSGNTISASTHGQCSVIPQECTLVEYLLAKPWRCTVIRSVHLGCALRGVGVVNVLHATQKMQQTKHHDSSMSNVHQHRGPESRNSIWWCRLRRRRRKLTCDSQNRKGSVRSGGKIE